MKNNFGQGGAAPFLQLLSLTTKTPNITTQRSMKRLERQRKKADGL